MPLLTLLCELWSCVLYVFIFLVVLCAIDNTRIQHTRTIYLYDPNGAEYISFEVATYGVRENAPNAPVPTLLTADGVAQEPHMRAGSNSGRGRRDISADSQRVTDGSDPGSSVTESASAASTSMSGETLVGSDAGTSMSGETLVGSEPGSSMSGDTLVGSVDSDWDMLE